MGGGRGRLAITIDGEETELDAGDVAIVPPDTPHSVRVLTACRAIITDYPLREQIPGLHSHCRRLGSPVPGGAPGERPD